MEAMSVPPFERFYVDHRDAVFGHLVRLLGRQQAEDAFQETFLRALRGYDSLRHGRFLRAWVFTIATRVAIDEGRKRLYVGTQNAYSANPAPYGHPISVVALDLATGDIVWSFAAPPSLMVRAARHADR